MSKIKQYDKGFSPPALQRKYSLTYVQGVEVADYIQGLKELLKECRKTLNKAKGDTVWYPVEIDHVVTKIDEVLK